MKTTEELMEEIRREVEDMVANIVLVATNFGQREYVDLMPWDPTGPISGLTWIPHRLKVIALDRLFEHYLELANLLPVVFVQENRAMFNSWCERMSGKIRELEDKIAEMMEKIRDLKLGYFKEMAEVRKTDKEADEIWWDRIPSPMAHEEIDFEEMEDPIPDIMTKCIRNIKEDPPRKELEEEAEELHPFLPGVDTDWYYAHHPRQVINCTITHIRGIGVCEEADDIKPPMPPIPI